MENTAKAVEQNKPTNTLGVVPLHIMSEVHVLIVSVSIQ